MPAKTAKYRNVRTVVDGIPFQSKKEAARYGVLKLMARAGEIQDLQLQVPYLLTVNGQKICRYVCDFKYVQGGKEVVEDVKGGVLTPAFRLKQKLMAAVYNITIKIV